MYGKTTFVFDLEKALQNKIYKTGDTFSSDVYKKADEKPLAQSRMPRKPGSADLQSVRTK